jgi:hypothetical protein
MGDPKTIPHCKGNCLRSFYETVQEKKGDSVAQEMLQSLSPEQREAFQLHTIVPNSWYPLEWLSDAYRALLKVTGGGVKMAESIGYHSAKKDFSGIYRIFFRLMKPETLLQKAARIFPTFYSMAHQDITESREGFARCKWYCPGFDANLWADTHGACRAALEICGARKVDIRFVSGGNDGDTEAVSEAFWVVGRLVRKRNHPEQLSHP